MLVKDVSNNMSGLGEGDEGSLGEKGEGERREGEGEGDGERKSGLGEGEEGSLGEKMREGEGEGDSVRLDSIREVYSDDDFENMVYSGAPADLPAVRREMLKQSTMAADRMKANGWSNTLPLEHLNRVGQKVGLPQVSIKNKNHNDIAPNEGGPKAGDSFQADLCVKFEQDVALHYFFRGLIENFETDVKPVAATYPNHPNFNDVRIRQGQYMCFEITLSLKKILSKIHQLVRLYSANGLKDDFIGKRAEIAVIGLIVSGDRKKFEDTAEKLRSFFQRASEDEVLSKYMIDKTIPIFLCRVNRKNLHTRVMDLKLSMEVSGSTGACYLKIPQDHFSRIDVQFTKIEERLAEDKQSMCDKCDDFLTNGDQ